MSYKKNEDGTYTCSRYMKLDGSLLESTAATLENAQRLLKQEVEAWKNYSLVETKVTYFSPSLPKQTGYILANDKLAEIINKEYEEGKANENSKNT